MISSAPYAKNMVVHTNHTTLMNVISSNPTVLLSKGMGAQEAHEETDILIKTVQIRENTKGQILIAQIIRKEVKKAFHKQSH